MSNLGNEPAYPAERDDGYGHVTKFCTGLTKRELFAAMVMQGFAAWRGPGLPAGNEADSAVEWADALLAKLAKEGTA